MPGDGRRSASGAIRVTLRDVNDYLDNIDPECFQYWCSQDKAPDRSEVRKFFDEIGFTLPEEFCDFSTSRFNGLYIEVPEEVWPRRQGGAVWWFLYGISVFGIGREVPDWLDLRVQYAQFQNAGMPDLLPIMRRVSDADRYCFTRDGQVVRWCHETHETMIVDGSFSDCLMRELLALEERKDRVVRGAIPK